MESNLLIKKIENILEAVSGGDIDWSATPNHLACYVAADHLDVSLCYDFSPATDDSDIAEKFWATYDAIYRAILTMLDLGTWERVRYALATDQIDAVSGDVAYAAIQASYQF